MEVEFKSNGAGHEPSLPIDQNGETLQPVFDWYELLFRIAVLWEGNRDDAS